MGHAQSNIDKAWATFQALDPVYFVTLRPELLPEADKFNQVAEPIRERIEASQNLYSRQDFTDLPTLLVFKNTPSLTP